MATEVAQLIFKADTSQVEKADKKVAQLGKTTQQTSNRAGQFGRTAGMAGIQVEQLAGQIAGGQNAMRALGAQAADLGFILGVPLAGAIVGIGAALLSMVPSLMGAEESTSELKERIKELDIEYRNLTASQQALLQLETDKQNKELIGQNEELQEKLNLVSMRLSSFQNGFKHAGDNAEYFRKNIKELTEEQISLTSQIDTNNAQINQNNESIDESVTVTNDYIESLREEMIQIGMNARQKAIYRAQTEGATETQIAEINAIYDTIDDKNSAIEAQKREQVERERAEQLAKRKAAQDKRDAELEKRRFDQRSQMASEQAAEMALLQLDEETRAHKQFENELIALKAQKDQKLITEQEYSEALAGIVAERSRTLTDIELKEEERKQKALADQREKDEETRKELLQKEIDAEAFKTDLLLSMDDKLLKGKSETTKAAYRIGVNLANEERRENAKKIISSSYTAAMGAYESLAPIPIVGPALGAAAAGTILAAGVSFAAKSLAGRALGGQVRPGESYVVGERGPEVLTMGNTLGKIATNESLRGSGTNMTTQQNVANVSFNINANDTRGFDRLLQSRRGQIVNMINQALNENGRSVLV